MKRRFATKLILSGAALAVSAATLVSTTYAWYVQNSQVTADGVSGNTKDKDASSIFISKNYVVDGNTGDWGPSVQFVSGNIDDTPTPGEHIPGVKIVEGETRYVTTAAPTEGKVYNGALDPVTRNSDGDFVFVNASTTKSGKAVDGTDFNVPASGRKIVFSLYVQSNTANTYVRPTLRIQNTTLAAAITSSAQTAYRHVKYETTDIEKGEKFWVDATQALRMSVSTAKDNGAAWDTTVDTKYYDVMDVAKNMTLTGTAYTAYSVLTTKDTVENVKFIEETKLRQEEVTYTPYGGVSTSANLVGAHQYYAGLTGVGPQATFVDAKASTYVNNGEIQVTKLAEANTAYKFTFELWLEGTDVSCFDSCENQTFNIAVDFEAITAARVIFNANGGTGSIAATTTTLGQKMSAPASTGLTGPDAKTFQHWSTTADDSAGAFNFANTNIEGDLVLYAIWA